MFLELLLHCYMEHGIRGDLNLCSLYSVPERETTRIFYPFNKRAVVSRQLFFSFSVPPPPSSPSSSLIFLPSTFISILFLPHFLLPLPSSLLPPSPSVVQDCLPSQTAAIFRRSGWLPKGQHGWACRAVAVMGPSLEYAATTVTCNSALITCGLGGRARGSREEGRTGGIIYTAVGSHRPCCGQTFQCACFKATHAPACNPSPAAQKAIRSHGELWCSRTSLGHEKEG